MLDLKEPAENWDVFSKEVCENFEDMDMNNNQEFSETWEKTQFLR